MTSKKYTVRYLVISYQLIRVGCVGFIFVYQKSLNIYKSKLKFDMYILVSDFFQKNMIYMYLILEIRIVRGEFLAFNYVTRFFLNKCKNVTKCFSTDYFPLSFHF